MGFPVGTSLSVSSAFFRVSRWSIPNRVKRRHSRLLALQRRNRIYGWIATRVLAAPASSLALLVWLQLRASCGESPVFRLHQLPKQPPEVCFDALCQAFDGFS